MLEEVAGRLPRTLRAGPQRDGPLLVLHPEADRRLCAVEQRLDRMEELLGDAVAYSSVRGKAIRNQLIAVEERLRARQKTLAKARQRSPGRAAARGVSREGPMRAAGRRWRARRRP